MTMSRPGLQSGGGSGSQAKAGGFVQYAEANASAVQTCVPSSIPRMGSPGGGPSG